MQPELADPPPPDRPLPDERPEQGHSTVESASDTTTIVDDAPDLLVRIDQAVTALAERVALDSERAAARERVIDRQHAEIERLRSAERSGVLRPVVTDLCRLRNDLLRQAGTVPEGMSQQQVSTLLTSFADVVEDALERCGVATMPAAVGSPFVAGRQQVASTVEVDDPAADGTVAAVVQDGYAEIDGGRVVLPARITVHRATRAAGTDEGTGEETA